MQDKIETFRLNNSIFDPIKESANLRLLQLELEDQKYSLEVYGKKLIDLKTKVENDQISVSGFNTTLNPNSLDPNASNGLVINDIDDSFLNEFVELKRDLSKLKLKYTENSDFVSSIERKINKLKPLIKAKQISAVETAMKFNKAELESSKAKIKQLNKDLLKNFISKRI